MAARKPPTERQRRLGAELRKMRERAGLSLTEAGVVHRVDKATISNIESARFGVSCDRVRVWAANYSCRDAAYIDALVEMARERGRHWWDDYRGICVPGAMNLAEVEHHAHGMRSVQIMHMPGLLQHEEYARSVFEEAVPAVAPEEIERRVAFRMRRKDVLDRTPMLACIFIIHEAALRMRFGGRGVIGSQLDHLLKQSERDNVTIRVVPFEAGGFTAVGTSTFYAYGPVPQLDTVQSDTPLGSRFMDAEADLANYRVVLDRMEQRSLSPERSRDFIQEMVQQL
ncbi:helix-turn-helix transcriptional regulator [Streptomyces sp. MST-110588]|uniref:helix-turn-helix domain-containing protein n=1 Tax=Streptomyces sp. MST-110588 TaxID=2833628 RepID=UPI001F5E0F38|nr:helix-turn-helix transcriptional regulator [Streptomyces sp. MST-110588]UNO41156.1 helix-turn-helix domain-containing protein [Streptomyces sp. MST-110588]